MKAMLVEFRRAAGATLALAVVFLVLLLLHMPTPLRVDEWIERQSLAVKELNPE